MRAALTTLTILTVLFFAGQISAQKLFKDSGQLLGNACSWNSKLGDLNGDGFLDALVQNNNGVDSEFRNEIWLNNGDATFTKSAQVLGVGVGTILFDLNGDGHLDLIENLGSNCRTLLNNGDANFSVSNNYPFRGNNILFDKNIYNNNKEVAVTSEVIGNNTRLRIYSLFKDSIRIRDSITIANFNLFFDQAGIVIGDLNNDGYSDMVLCQMSGSTYILFNNHSGGFTISNQKLGNGVGPNLYLADLNGDGALDLLQCNYHTMADPPVFVKAHLYFNDGTGKFTEADLPYNSSYITPNAAIADFDNDGDLDIYLNHGHQDTDWTHQSEILFNDGKGNFTSSTISLDAVQSISVSFGDLDNDGDLDAFLSCGKYYMKGLALPNMVWLNTTNDGPNTVKQNKNEEFRIFPNPSNGQSTLFFGAKIQQVIVEIDNLQGALVFSKTYQNSTSAAIDLTVNSPGIYLVKVIANGISYQKKMVKK